MIDLLRANGMSSFVDALMDGDCYARNGTMLRGVLCAKLDITHRQLNDLVAACIKIMMEAV